MRSFRDSAGFTLAVAVERREANADEEGAEVIDLVHLPTGARPTPFASLEYEEVSRCRVLDCSTYNDCLEFAARLRWPSFHCRQCPKYVAGTEAEPTAARRERPAHRRLSGASGPDASIIKLR